MGGAVIGVPPRQNYSSFGSQFREKNFLPASIPGGVTVSGVGDEMTKITQSQAVPWGVFQWVVTGLLSLVAALIGVAWLTMKSDIGEIKTIQIDMRRDFNEARIDTIRSIGSVEKQAAITNQKLDSVIDELRRKSR